MQKNRKPGKPTKSISEIEIERYAREVKSIARGDKTRRMKIQFEKKNKKIYTR